MEQMVEAIHQKFPNENPKVIRGLIDSLIGNMPKVASDLRDDLLEGIGIQYGA